MRLRISHFLLLGIILSLAGFANAQPPVPKVKVTFDNPVIVGSQTLQPGQYTFEEVNGPGATPVWRVMNDQGLNITLSPVAEHGRVPENATDQAAVPSATSTQVVLQEIGGKYYLDKIWVRGRTRGWNFQIPESVKSQGNMHQHVIQANSDND